MSNLTGKKLLESFVRGATRGCPAGPPPDTDPGKLRCPVQVPYNPKKDVPVPSNMQHLRVDERGYRVPVFVGWPDGKPDFRCVEPGVIRACVAGNACWICGREHEYEQRLVAYKQTYVIGPMCLINRISAEPGSHLECARYAARVCPFLSAPHMRRNEKDMPENKRDPGGFFIKRNPGVMALWTTADYHIVKAGDQALFRVGDPLAIEFWREGRHATKAEILESINTGLPILEQEASRGDRPAQAHAQLHKMVQAALKIVDQYA